MALLKGLRHALGSIGMLAVVGCSGTSTSGGGADQQGSSSGASNTSGTSAGGTGGLDNGRGGAAGAECRGFEDPVLVPVCAGCQKDLECVVLSDSFAWCGTSDPPEATECATDSESLPDLCGCDGQVCPSGERCVAIYETVSGGFYHRNECFAVCGSHEECGSGRACMPNRWGFNQCITPECESDADCTKDRCGHCVPTRRNAFQGMVWTSGTPMCLYEGPSSEADCNVDGTIPTPYLDAHVCN